MNDAVLPIEGNILTDSPSIDEANIAMNLPRARTPLTDVYTY